MTELAGARVKLTLAQSQVREESTTKIKYSQSALWLRSTSTMLRGHQCPGEKGQVGLVKKIAVER